MLTIDGGDLGCGELLLLVHRQVRAEPAGTLVAIVTTDPGAPIDVPAWCHLTGNTYRGRRAPDTYLLELGAEARTTQAQSAWRLQPQPVSPTSKGATA